MTTNNLTNSTALEEPDTLEDLLTVTGDPGPEPTLPPDVATFLGEQLQAYYAQLMNEPVPERFVQLLQQLDGKKKSHDGE
ncbi:NepR family anti-sigma factor [Microvirga pakistanensis]|uniref:NepR family anti-sigma factor n=1 Tax=Microvirga pakistanensis TaxID=1682650 RepID=UPI001069942F|nr:NepR family anti-sigma factor [Microvirga pakistanensis]